MKCVLFDLDGTLLPMDQDVFVNGYFGFLVQKMAPRGYEARKLIETIWAGTAAMVKNDGTRTNEEAFWDCFVSVFGPSARDDVPVFEEFYAEDFQQARACPHFFLKNPLILPNRPFSVSGGGSSS